MSRVRTGNGMRSIKKTTRFHSLRIKLIIWALVLILPILIIFFINIRAASVSIEEQIRITGKQILNMFSGQIDTILHDARRYIANTEMSLDFLDQDYADQLMRLNMVRELGSTLSEDLAVHEHIDAVFVFARSELWFIQNYDRDYLRIKACADVLEDLYLRQPEKAGAFRDGYDFLKAGNEYYLYISVQVQGGVFGCFFSVRNLLSNLIAESYGSAGNLSGVVLGFSGQSSGETEILFLDPENHDAFDPEEFFIMSKTLLTMPYDLSLFWQHDTIFRPSAKLFEALISSFVISCALFLLFILFLRFFVLKPLQSLTSTIGLLHDGEFHKIQVKKNEDQELKSVFDALNTLISQIDDLKVKMYEEKLLKQQTELQLYQLQIRPHFFLNILNSIVSYARDGSYDNVSRMTMHLASHSRYILYNSWLVSVEEELEYTRNFIDMHNLQYARRIPYFTEIDEDVFEYQIPILSIQVFVENCLKYGAADGSQIKIGVKIERKMVGGMSCLSIEISDNGVGFSEKLLAQLAAGKQITSDTGECCLGIENVRSRLVILYNHDFSLKFSNLPGGGAHVEMCVPSHHEGIL